MSRIANIRRTFAVAALVAVAGAASVSSASAFGHFGGMGGGGGFGGARIVGAHFGGARISVGQIGGSRFGGFHVGLRGPRGVPGGRVVVRHPGPRLPRVTVNGCRGDRCPPTPVPVCKRHPWFSFCHRLPPVAFCLLHPHAGFCHGRPPVIGLIPTPAVGAGVATTAAIAPAAYSPAPTCVPPGSTISIVFQPTATSADITAFLKFYSVTMADGPNPDGVYRIRLPADVGSAQQQMLDAMRAQATIVSSISG